MACMPSELELHFVDNWDVYHMGLGEVHCGTNVQPLTNGSFRNHCPRCLHSLHVDHKPGDRANACRGLMAPVGLAYRRKKGWQIVHRCTVCGQCSVNKVAIDTVQADSIKRLSEIGVRPLFTHPT